VIPIAKYKRHILAAESQGTSTHSHGSNPSVQLPTLLTALEAEVVAGPGGGTQRLVAVDREQALKKVVRTYMVATLASKNPRVSTDSTVASAL
jgi:hypothetical protein